MTSPCHSDCPSTHAVQNCDMLPACAILYLYWRMASSPPDMKLCSCIQQVSCPVKKLLINRISFRFVGSLCDMEWKASVSSGAPKWKQEYRFQPRVYKGTAGGRAYQFGAATDDQTAADTNKLSGNVSTGAATFSFIQVRLQAQGHGSRGGMGSRTVFQEPSKMPFWGQIGCKSAGHQPVRKTCPVSGTSQQVGTDYMLSHSQGTCEHCGGRMCV